MAEVFKIGDVVKQKKSSQFYHQSKEKKGKITGKESGSNWFKVKWIGGGEYNYLPSHLDKVAKGKAKKVNFLLKYDLDQDPVEEFETLEQVKKRIPELVEEHGDTLQRDSIVVYEIKKVSKVTLETVVTIKGI